MTKITPQTLRRLKPRLPQRTPS